MNSAILLNHSCRLIVPHLQIRGVRTQAPSQEEEPAYHHHISLCGRPAAAAHCDRNGRHVRPSRALVARPPAPLRRRTLQHQRPRRAVTAPILRPPAPPADHNGRRDRVRGVVELQSVRVVPDRDPRDRGSAHVPLSQHQRARVRTLRRRLDVPAHDAHLALHEHDRLKRQRVHGVSQRTARGHFDDKLERCIGVNGGFNDERVGFSVQLEYELDQDPGLLQRDEQQGRALRADARPGAALDAAQGTKVLLDAAPYVDVINLIVPAGKNAEQTLFDIVNGLHMTMCTVSGTNTLCGQMLINYLATAESEAKSLLSAILFKGGLPLYALPDSGSCAALDAKTISSRVVADASIPYFAYSCCSAGLSSFMEAIDASLARLTGNTVTEMLNLITAKQNLEETVQFKAPYDTLSKCSFTQTCSNPAFVLPTSFGSASTESSAGLTAKTAQPKRVVCTKVDVCDSAKVCSSVCQPGTVKIAPWAARALSFQRNQSYDKSLCYTQLPGTHNSATTAARGYGNRDQLFNKVLNASNPSSYMRTNNQLLSLQDQLQVGVRFLEVDVHYFGATIRSGHCSGISFSLINDASATLVSELTSILSGGDSANPVTVEWDSSLFGCLPSLSGIRAEEQRLHSDTLVEISSWLKNNTGELLVLYTEIGDELTTFSKMDTLLKLYTDNFGDLIFTPADLKASGGSWTEFTLSELIGKGKRVILVTTPTENDLMFKMTSLCDGWSNVPGGTTTGTTLWGKKYNSGSLVRAFRSALHYATLTEDDLQGQAAAVSTAVNPTTLNAATLPTFVNAGVNLVAPDLLDGEMMEAMVWSWAAKEPTNGDTAAEISAADGRWYGVVDKSTIENVACVSSSDRTSWRIVAQGLSCPSGFVVGVPVLAIENAALVTALKATGTTATAQLNIDISAFPTISEAEEKEFENASASPTGSSGGGGSSSSIPSTPTSTAGSSHAVGGRFGTLCLTALVALWMSAARD